MISQIIPVHIYSETNVCTEEKVEEIGEIKGWTIASIWKKKNLMVPAPTQEQHPVLGIFKPGNDIGSGKIYLFKKKVKFKVIECGDILPYRC